MQNPSIKRWEDLGFNINLMRDSEENLFLHNLDKRSRSSDGKIPGLPEMLMAFSKVSLDTCTGEAFDLWAYEIRETVEAVGIGEDELKHLNQMVDPLVVEFLSSCFRFSWNYKWDWYFGNIPAIYSVWATKSHCEDHGLETWDGITKANVDYFSFQYPLYVGQTTDMESRMKSHHRMKEFDFLHNCGLDLKLYFLPETPFRPLRSNLYQLESKLIELLQPVLNNQLLTQLASKEELAIA